MTKVRPFTMVPQDWLVDLARQVRAVLTQGVPGDFVECGVWRGGAASLMADLLRQGGASFMVFAWPAFWWLDRVQPS